MFENVEDAFKDLDSNEFNFFASALAAYRRSLQKKGFTRREAMKLVEAYSRFIYDMSIEEFLSSKREDEDIDRGIDDEDEIA